MNTAIPLIITDPIYKQQARTSRLNKFFASLLNDVRNVPFIYFMLLVLFTTVPFGVLLFIPGMLHWWLALPYFLFNVIFLMGSFASLMLWGSCYLNELNICEPRIFQTTIAVYFVLPLLSIFIVLLYMFLGSFFKKGHHA